MRSLLVALVAGALLAGCAAQHKDSRLTTTSGEEITFSPAVAPVHVTASSERYVVVRGDCLWAIAGGPEIYNDPFCWPALYKANIAAIGSDPDVIEPGQSLIVVRDFDKDAARGIASQWPVYKGKK